MTRQGAAGVAAPTFAAALAAGWSARADDAPKAAGGGQADAAPVAQGKALYANHGENNRMPAWRDIPSGVEINELWAYIHSKKQP
jgi:hypothetical protein